jgi:hypothetical protein
MRCCRRLSDALHQSAAGQALQQPEDRGLAELSALHHLGQTDGLSLVTERFQDIAGPHHRVRVASIPLHRYLHQVRIPLC